MTDTEARQALLLRAFEHPLAAPWTRDDSLAIDAEAQRQLGTGADAERYIARRAAIGLARLAPRAPAVTAALAATDAQPLWARIGLLAAALAGAAADVAGSGGRINILAPPLLALMLWNLFVYAALAWRALAPPQAAGGGLVSSALSRIWQAMQRRWAGAAGAAVASGTSDTPMTRYLADWARFGAALHAARLAALLHAGAAAFALAALASLYVRGLGFEYRAGWDSTFLTPAAVHTLLQALFGPASALTGIGLPGSDQLAALRFSTGAGENAARWIHLQAVTVVAVVVLPRLALAAHAAWRVRLAAGAVTLPLDEPDFARLARLAFGGTVGVAVLPYSFELNDRQRTGLRAPLEAQLGGGVELRIAANVALGGEDVPADWAAALAGPAVAALLFNATATPERETHGAFCAAVAARLRPAQRLLVLVDEAAFRLRFTGVDGAQRLAQRRDAWRRMLAEAGLGDARLQPLFIDTAAKSESARHERGKSAE